jgi:hypothetical protein
MAGRDGQETGRSFMTQNKTRQLASANPPSKKQESNRISSSIYRTGGMICGCFCTDGQCNPHRLGSQIPGQNPLARTTRHTPRLQLAIVSDSMTNQQTGKRAQPVLSEAKAPGIVIFRI